jgi:tetratricopeptide (TPR) repeat protein
VSESKEAAAAGAEGNGVGSNPTAVALALAGASREDAHEFLKKQGQLIDDQRHHLHEQLKQIHLDVWEKSLGVLLRVATAFVGIAVAAALVWLVWYAANSNDLVIDSFAVPPELAARGLSGPVVAAKLSDRIASMQSQTISNRPPKSYANGLSEGLKLEIPETGVSLYELDRYLREKLGHDLHIGGELVQTGKGVALTARVGSNGSATVAGAEADMDNLLQNLAEDVYRITQPYRFAVYLNNHGRTTDALPVLKDLARNGAKDDRSWALNLLGLTARDRDGADASMALASQAVALRPTLVAARMRIALLASEKGWAERSLEDDRIVLSQMATGDPDVSPQFVPATRDSAQAQIDMFHGAFVDAAREQLVAIQSGVPGRYELSAEMARAELGAHDLAAARAALAEPVVATPSANGIGTLYNLRASMMIDAAAGNWLAVEAAADAGDPAWAKAPGVRRDIPTLLSPIRAYAEAKLGRLAAAEARIAPAPSDCYDCLIARARIAGLRDQHGRADYWFGRAAVAAPSIPFAWSFWGEALLARGKPDEAIEKFIIANQKGPHFADPLEGWGEALMAKNQSHLALAKFAEAEKYAPNWGRLHLKWGEALVYSRHADEAKAQFARAAHLDLTPSEAMELGRDSEAAQR